MKGKINLVFESAGGVKITTQNIEKKMEKVERKISKAFKKHFKSKNIIIEIESEMKSNKEMEIIIDFKKIGNYKVDEELVKKNPNLEAVTLRTLTNLCDEMVNFFKRNFTQINFKIKII